MRLSFDHRVLDGAMAARRLADMEEVLLGPMVLECADQPSSPISAEAPTESFSA